MFKKYREYSHVNKEYKSRTVEIKIAKTKKKNRVTVYSHKDIQNNKITIDGYIYRRNTSICDNSKNDFLELNNGTIKVHDKKRGHCIGYILTDLNHAIGVIDNLPLKIICTGITLIIAFLVFNHSTVDIPKLADTVNYDGTQDYVEVPTTENTGTAFDGKSRNPVTEKQKTIKLGNPECNHCYMRIQVVDESSGDIAQDYTDYIEPGQAVEFNAYDYFKGIPGIYKVTYNVETSSLDDVNIKGTPLNIVGVEVQVY